MSTASVLQAGITPYPVLTQLLFTYYPNSVISKKIPSCSRSISDLEGLLGKLEGGRLVISELTCVAADSEMSAHQVPRLEKGQQRLSEGWSRYRVYCTHNRLDWGKKRRAHTNQMSLCQR